MANWQRRIDLTKVWETENPVLIAKEIAKQLRELKPFGLDYVDGEIEYLIDTFEDIDDGEEFDCAMNQLYNWGDIDLDNGKVCWVEK